MKKNRISVGFLMMTIGFLLFFFISLFSLYQINIPTYFTTKVILLNSKKILLVVEKEKKEMIQKQKYFYYRDQKISYQIEEQENQKEYNSYVLSLSKKIKEKNMGEISFLLKKEKLWIILYENWRLE